MQLSRFQRNCNRRYASLKLRLFVLAQAAIECFPWTDRKAEIKLEHEGHSVNSMLVLPVYRMFRFPAYFRYRKRDPSWRRHDTVSQSRPSLVEEEVPRFLRNDVAGFRRF